MKNETRCVCTPGESWTTSMSRPKVNNCATNGIDLWKTQYPSQLKNHNESTQHIRHKASKNVLRRHTVGSPIRAGISARMGVTVREGSEIGLPLPHAVRRRHEESPPMIHYVRHCSVGKFDDDTLEKN